MNPTIDRKRIVIFLCFAYGIAFATALVIYFTGGLTNSPKLLSNLTLAIALMATGYMYAPTIANIATRLITHEGWSNTFLRPNFRRGWRFWLAAWLLPTVVSILGGLAYYLAFPGQFDLSLPYVRSLIAQSPQAAAMNPWTVLLSQSVFVILLAPWMNCIATFGEEFGWRAYLLQKLLPLGQRKALILMGVIWGVWHWPVIFMGYEYGFKYWGAPVVGPLLFMWITFVFGTFLAWVSQRGGSVWPAVLGHGAINATAALMILFINGQPNMLLGPTTVGLIGSLGYAVIALLVIANPRALSRDEAPAMEPVTATENI